MDKPDFVTETMLVFLDNLRASGKTNMYGAVPHIRKKYPDLTGKESIRLLTYWMETYSSRHA